MTSLYSIGYNLYNMSNETKKEAAKRQYRRLKGEVLEHYSCFKEGKLTPGSPQKPYCASCGEDDLNALCLRHDSSEGTIDRKELGWGQKFFYNLQARGYPEGFQVLCANCALKRHKSL